MHGLFNQLAEHASSQSGISRSQRTRKLSHWLNLSVESSDGGRNFLVNDVGCFLR